MNTIIRWEAKYQNQRGVYVVAPEHAQDCIDMIHAKYGYFGVHSYAGEHTERPVTWQPPVEARQMTIWEVV